MRYLALVLVVLAACHDRAQTPAPVTDAPPPPPQTADAPAPSATDSTASAAAKADDNGVTPSDDYYGLYFQGNKVGWMRTTVTAARVMTTELYAKVGGMGQVSEVRFNEQRTYGADGALQLITFSQSAATGAVTVRGERHGKMLSVTSSAGGASRAAQDVEVSESFDDALRLQKLAADGKVGASATAKRYDPSVMQVVTAQSKVAGVEKKVFGGVETEVVKIDTTYPELQISESAWVDKKGTTLESRIGGFFVARLEAPDEAKRLDFSQDLLVSAVVATPKPINAQQDLTKMTVRFSGFNDPPPASPRQAVSKADKDVVLTLTRDTAPKVPWKAGQKITGANPVDLEATPFIQSDDPAIIAAARQAVGDASDVYTATTRLVHFVYDYVADEYVPAYSNALEALNSKRGDCTEHSVLFVALARALGIPARVAVGIAYWPPGKGFGWHAWAEVYANGAWYTVDPTWDQPIADVTHVKLASGGPAEQARIVMVLGQLKVVELKI